MPFDDESSGSADSAGSRAAPVKAAKPVVKAAAVAAELAIARDNFGRLKKYIDMTDEAFKNINKKMLIAAALGVPSLDGKKSRDCTEKVSGLRQLMKTFDFLTLDKVDVRSGAWVEGACVAGRRWREPGRSATRTLNPTSHTHHPLRRC